MKDWSAKEKALMSLNITATKQNNGRIKNIKGKNTP